MLPHCAPLAATCAPSLFSPSLFAPAPAQPQAMVPQAMPAEHLEWARHQLPMEQPVQHSMQHPMQHSMQQAMPHPGEHSSLHTALHPMPHVPLPAGQRAAQNASPITGLLEDELFAAFSESELVMFEPLPADSLLTLFD